MLAVVESSPEITGPQREVISIYDDDFVTSPSRPLYFIEIYRCVKLEMGDCHSGQHGYPVPKTTDEIEIVVPDITNKDRDSSKKKFYKYVVYNHTSCTCGTLIKYRESTLYKNITNNEVSEADYKASYTKNPVNLIRACNICNSAQPRYKLHPKHATAVSRFIYMEYQQCLPGCVVVRNKTSNKQTSMVFGSPFSVPFTSDILCEAYDGTKTQQEDKNHPQMLKSSPSKASFGNSSGQEPNYEILVYIASGKVILAAVLLSLVLFTILIMDFTLCRRKKGFLYALFDCISDDADNFCQRCSERNRNEITV
ncbi:Hypothetical predicted protein [Paramuricea clavata]|uniref:Uncharacterized protein n=1 Tax=Paramuricea clavata TaxID=317549 RepID=A0A6S7J4D4_PARCT|nr:Hypothetical predicted protein [Paramuricea clavata]